MRFFIRSALVCCLSLFLGACTQAGLFLANLPAAVNGAQLYKDIPYGDDPAQKLDIYLPQQSENAPVLVFFYGGRWTFGYKEQYRFVADAFIRHGYGVIIPDTRKYPDVRFPAFAEDAAAAIAWIHEHIADYGADPDQIFVVGHSSGAHIAALIATDPQYLAAHGLDRTVIKAFAGLSGPYAFEPEEDDLKDMFGPPERYPLMRASNFVDGQQPPMLLIHGLADDLVVVENAQKLKGQIDQKGGKGKLLTYDRLDHVETVGSLMWFWRYKSDIKIQILDFFQTLRS